MGFTKYTPVNGKHLMVTFKGNFDDFLEKITRHVNEDQVKGQNRHLSATETGLITAASSNFAKRLPKG